MIKRKICILIFSLIAVALYGCGRNELLVNNMIMQKSEMNLSPIGKSCCVSPVEGRKEANAILPLTSTLLEQAIIENLKTSNFFSTVIFSDKKDTDYSLSVRLLGQPQDSSSTTTCLYTRYRLIRNTTGEVIFDKRYQSVYTSPEKDLNKSMEGAVKGNIKELINDLAKLQL